MIDTGWKRTTGSPYWETAGHDRLGMPETVQLVSASYRSSFLFRKTGTYIAQARTRGLRMPETAGNRKSQNGKFHALFGTFCPKNGSPGTKNGTPGWPKTESPYGPPRLSGPLFLDGDKFLKSGEDTALGRNQEETIGKDQTNPRSHSHSRKATR